RPSRGAIRSHPNCGGDGHWPGPHLSTRARGPGRPDCAHRRAGDGGAGRDAAPARPLSGAQSDHLRSEQRGSGGRGGGAQWRADHGQHGGPGRPRGVRGAGQHRESTDRGGGRADRRWRQAGARSRRNRPRLSNPPAPSRPRILNHTMATPLIIVESPAKAKTLSRFLNGQYDVRASMGHVRDLPKSQLGIDVEHGFTLDYVVIPGKESIIKELTAAAKKASQVLLAYDPDRAREAIAWHLAAALHLREPQRIELHEVTPTAVQHALETPRPMNQDLIDAQQARRVIDRLVGYKLSPLLWKKIRRGLSAGRVQSVAVRLVCEREAEI